MQSRRLVTFLSAAVVVPLLAATHVPSGTSFTDVPGSAWFAAYVEQASEAGIVTGYRDQYGNLTGRFGPENPVTIGEALKISLEGAGYDTSQGVGYGHWAAKYMSIAIGHGFQVTQINALNLDRPATRAEVASLIADAFRIDHSTFTGGQYTDVTAGTAYAGSIQALSRVGIVSGDTDATGNPTGRFRPNAAINRAETVKIVIGARAVFGMPGRHTSLPSTSSSSSSRSTGSCHIQDCGPAPNMPNWQCPNGSIAGPSCERLPDGRCGWLIRQCPATSSSSSSSSSSSIAAQTYILNYTNTGFQPSFVSIRNGDSVKFRNQSDIGMWVASNPHPTHNDYPEFDQHASIAKGGEFTFRFSKSGVWGFHNHMNANHQAVVSVDSQ